MENLRVLAIVFLLVVTGFLVGFIAGQQHVLDKQIVKGDYQGMYAVEYKGQEYTYYYDGQ